MIRPEVLHHSLLFEEYMELSHAIAEEKIERTGVYTADTTLRYTRSNVERMHKVLENIVLNQKLYNVLNDLPDEWLWVIISEPWCGDASWGTPALSLIASATEKIECRIVLRDKSPELIKAYQTEGSDSIPKLICLRKRDGKELGTWGPRPKVLQQEVLKRINTPGFDYRESVRAIHAWYEDDMTKTTQEEIILCVKHWKEIK